MLPNIRAIIASIVINILDLVSFLILKLANAISEETNKKVMLPNSRIYSNPPIKIKKLEIETIVIIA